MGRNSAGPRAGSAPSPPLRREVLVRAKGLRTPCTGALAVVFGVVNLLLPGAGTVLGAATDRRGADVTIGVLQLLALATGFGCPHPQPRAAVPACDGATACRRWLWGGLWGILMVLRGFGCLRVPHPPMPSVSSFIDPASPVATVPAIPRPTHVTPPQPAAGRAARVGDAPRTVPFCSTGCDRVARQATRYGAPLLRPRCPCCHPCHSTGLAPHVVVLPLRSWSCRPLVAVSSQWLRVSDVDVSNQQFQADVMISCAYEHREGESRLRKVCKQLGGKFRAKASGGDVCVLLDVSPTNLKDKKSCPFVLAAEPDGCMPLPATLPCRPAPMMRMCLCPMDPFFSTLPAALHGTSTAVFRTFYEDLELQNFPFDIQRLHITLESEFADGLVQFVPNYVKPEPVWANHRSAHYIPGSNPQPSSPPDASGQSIYNRISVAVTLKRKPSFFLWNIYLIQFLVVSLGFLYPMSPPEEYGDRLNTLLMTLLTCVAFRQFSSEFTPQIPYQTLLDRFLLLSTGLLTVLCVVCFLGTFLGDCPHTEKYFLWCNRIGMSSKDAEIMETYMWLVCCRAALRENVTLLQNMHLAPSFSDVQHALLVLAYTPQLAP
eukprot:gene4444-806_t